MYNWENSNSKSKSKSKFDPNKNPSFSSSFLSKFSKSPKTHPSKSYQIEEFNLHKSTTKTPKYTTKTPKNLEDDKISPLRRACLVEKWMGKKVSHKVISREEKKLNHRSSSSNLPQHYDLQDSFFSNTTTKSNTTSTCLAPLKPKPIKTHSIESKYLYKNDKNNSIKNNSIKNHSMGYKFYSNLNNLKQPISPGIRLTSFINSLFTKESKKINKTLRNATKQRKEEETRPSFSRSCLVSKEKNFHDDGIKPTVRFCPQSVIVDHDSQACGYKSLQEESENLLINSELKRSLSKGYLELKKFNGFVKESNKEFDDEIALDYLLSDYWDAKLNNKSYDLNSKIKGHNDGDYEVNQGVIYDQNYEDNDDGFSCSSSDLFELDHLSLIGDELPVYETTQI